MDAIDRERLAELYMERDAHRSTDRNLWLAYFQGRIDEYAAQNAITSEELALAASDAGSVPECRPAIPRGGNLCS